MERIYELETGDFIDLDSIIFIKKIWEYRDPRIDGEHGPFRFARLIIKCKLMKEPVFVDIFGDESSVAAQRIRLDLIKKWKKWTKETK